MGEKIKDLASIEVWNTEYEIELNLPSSRGQESQVHIQSDSFRIEIDESEYIRVAIAIKFAAEKLRHLKKLK